MRRWNLLSIFLLQKISAGIWGDEIYSQFFHSKKLAQEYEAMKFTLNFFTPKKLAGTELLEKFTLNFFAPKI